MIKYHWVTAVYAAKNEDRIVRAPRGATLLAHSIATPSLVAAIMNAKYTNAIPLYRLHQEFERNGVKISVPTMANWVIRCAQRYLQPVYDKLHEELCKAHIVQADETPCQVNKDGRPANAKSYMFVYCSGELEKERGIVLYTTRKQGTPTIWRSSSRTFPVLWFQTPTADTTLWTGGGTISGSHIAGRTHAAISQTR